MTIKQNKNSLIQIWWNIEQKHKKGESEEAALALEMANVEGVFYVLVGGVWTATVMAFILVLLETRSVAKENEVCCEGYKMHRLLAKLQIVCRKKPETLHLLDTFWTVSN